MSQDCLRSSRVPDRLNVCRILDTVLLQQNTHPGLFLKHGGTTPLTPPTAPLMIITKYSEEGDGERGGGKWEKRKWEAYEEGRTREEKS